MSTSARRWLATSNLRVNVGTVVRICARRVARARVSHAAGPRDPDQLRRHDGRSPARRATAARCSTAARRSTCRSRRASTPRSGPGSRSSSSSTSAAGGRTCRGCRPTTSAATAAGSATAGIPEWKLRPRGLHDSFALWAGVEQLDVSDDQPFRVGGRIGFETSSRRRPPDLADHHRAHVGHARPRRAGAARAVAGRSCPTGCSTSRACRSTTARSIRAAGSSASTSGYDYETLGCAAVRNGYAIPTAAGDYRRVRARAAARIPLCLPVKR